jgi:oxygen-independent coproporphyrinogen-3 oxidase
MLTDTLPDDRVRASLPPEVPRALLLKYGRPAPRYTSYPPIPAWDRSIGPAEYRAALESVAGEQAEPLSLYVHLPFCRQRCLYCGCNVVITRRQSALETYLERLRQELDLVTRRLGRDRAVAQLHLGGGTPNYMADDELERLARIIGEHFTLSADADTAIEADPRLSTPDQLRTLRDLGFRRVSFGVQDLDPHVQLAIGRVHPLEKVRRTIEAARAAGFEGINIDLMYGLPGQTPDGFRRTIETIVELAPDRVACFGYAHVPTLRPHQRALDQYVLPDPVERFALNRTAIDGLTAGGYVWIGLDHFARPGDPLALAARAGRLHRNFNGYTTRPADHLIAAGMSAIGEVGGLLVQNDGDLAAWHAAIAQGRFATVRGHRLTEDDRRRRAAILSLMCDLALPPALAEGLDQEVERLLDFTGDGLVERQGAAVTVTPVGRYFLRTLCSVFDAYLPAAAQSRPMAGGL